VFCGLQRGEELAAHYASGDLFLFPSLSETFGNVVLEALASGLGVVAFDQAAAAQHIRHGHNGALAGAQDEQGFIQAANELLNDAEGLRRARLNARRHAAGQGWAAIVELFEQHLRSAMQPAAQLPAGSNAALK
jgi:glycosyltransferase involved in cell wall biosynthesis